MVIGDEILDGRRQDAHVDALRRLLTPIGIDLAYVLFLPDNLVVLTAQLRWAFARPEPFFGCGGIGSTPDDLTREAAAAAAAVPIERHPEGEAILRGRWGKEATPARLRMVDFPEGAALIPNPVNQVPGFSIRNGHFVPGFPEMARPMMQWVIEHHFTAGEPRHAETLILRGVREADLVDLMETFIAAHPDVSLSSLPRFVKGGGTELHLGIKGSRRGVVLEALGALENALQAAGVAISNEGPSTRN